LKNIHHRADLGDAVLSFSMQANGQFSLVGFQQFRSAAMSATGASYIDASPGAFPDQGARESGKCTNYQT